MKPRQRLIVVAVDATGLFRQVCLGISEMRGQYPDARILVVASNTDPVDTMLNPDAVILQGGNPVTLQRWAHLQVPMLNVSNTMKDSGLPKLCSDDIRVGELAAEHFLERKLPHAAMISQGGPYHAMLRYQGFQRVMREADIPVQRYASGGLDPFPMYRPLPELEQWILDLPKPCGIFCGDDLQAKCVLDRLYALQVPVPEAFCVLGVNDEELTCDLSPVPISSVGLNGREIGREALRLVMEALNGTPLPQDIAPIPPLGVTPRMSTDLFVARDPLVSKALQLIQKHLHEELDVQWLCNELHVSRRVLERHFQQHMKSAPYEAITQARLQRAKQLLKDRPELTVSKISELCGYRQGNLFYRQFRQREHCSPGEWRVEHLHTQS